jgi:hypothetical protein
MALKLIGKFGQSNNGAAKNAYACTNDFPIFAGRGRIINGRDPGSGVVLPETELSQIERYGFNQAVSGTESRYGWAGACADTLVAGGVPASDFMFVPNWKGGTTSLEWSTALATRPFPDGTVDPITVAHHRMHHALSMTDTVLGAIVIYQGESNANGQVGAGPAEWPVDWGLICDDLATEFAGRFLHPTKKFIFIELFSSVPSGFADWNAVCSAQETFVAGRSDCVLIRAPNGPFNSGAGEDVHLDAGTTADNGQRGLGKLIGLSCIADFGFAA